jgi:hypothetical protein
MTRAVLNPSTGDTSRAPRSQLGRAVRRGRRPHGCRDERSLERCRRGRRRHRLAPAADLGHASVGGRQPLRTTRASAAVPSRASRVSSAPAAAGARSTTRSRPRRLTPWMWERYEASDDRSRRGIPRPSRSARAWRDAAARTTTSPTSTSRATARVTSPATAACRRSLPATAAVRSRSPAPRSTGPR